MGYITFQLGYKKIENKFKVPKRIKRVNFT